MNDKTFVIKFDELPPSVNNYLKPSARIVKGKAIPYMYESQEAKDFKKMFGSYLKREVRKQGWDKSITAEGHWYLDCYFIQARTNQDNNNYYKILCDALTGIVIEDDRNILVRTQKVLYDASNPKFIAILKQSDYKGIFSDEDSYNNFVSDNCLNCSRFKRNCSILKKAVEGRLQDDISSENNVVNCKQKKVKKS